jgi:hypothetical protein
MPVAITKVDPSLISSGVRWSLSLVEQARACSPGLGDPEAVDAAIAEEEQVAGERIEG